jgi:hypothetical protein
MGASQDRGEDDAASVDEGVLVVAAGQTAPVLHAVEEALDDVALLVVLDVVGGQPSAGPADAVIVWFVPPQLRIVVIRTSPLVRGRPDSPLAAVAPC